MSEIGEKQFFAKNDQIELDRPCLISSVRHVPGTSLRRRCRPTEGNHSLVNRDVTTATRSTLELPHRVKYRYTNSHRIGENSPHR